MSLPRRARARGFMHGNQVLHHVLHQVLHSGALTQLADAVWGIVMEQLRQGDDRPNLSSRAQWRSHTAPQSDVCRPW